MRAEANLEVLLLLLFAFETDGYLLHPGVLRQSLLVLGHGLFDFGHPLLHFLVLSRNRPGESCTACKNKQGGYSNAEHSEWRDLHKSPLSALATSVLAGSS